MDAFLDRIGAWLGQGLTEQGVDVAALAKDVPAVGAPAESVVRHCLTALEELQGFDTKMDRLELMSIPLQDMKVVSRLVQVVIVYGIYPLLPARVGVPMAPRTKWVLPASGAQYSPGFLVSCIGTLVQVLGRKDDIADVILLTPFMTDILAGAAALTREDHQQYLDDLVGIIPTYSLYSLLCGLLRPDAPPWLQALLAHELAVIPLKRSDSVKAMIEFFSGYREGDGDVNIDTLGRAVSVLSAVPKGVSPKVYFPAVAEQLFAILANLNAPKDILTATLIVVDKIDQTKPKVLAPLREILVAPFEKPGQGDVEKSLVALSHLMEKETKFVVYLAGKLYGFVWLVLVALHQDGFHTAPVATLLEGFLKLNPAIADDISALLLATSWAGVAVTVAKLPAGQVGAAPDAPKVAFVAAAETTPALDSVDTRLQLVTLLLKHVDPAVINRVYAASLKRYIIASSPGSSGPTDIARMVADMRLLEALATEFKEQLLSDPREIVELTLGVVSVAANAEQEQPAPETGPKTQDPDRMCSDTKYDPDLVAMCLGLLSTVMMETPSESPVIAKIAGSLNDITILESSPDDGVKSKAIYCKNLLETIQSGKDITMGDENIDYNDSSQVYKLAKESLNEPVIPIRAHGMRLIEQLVANRDPIVGLNEAVSIFVRELHDEDSYIYLNAIRGLEVCSGVFGASKVVQSLIPAYAAPDDVDFILRTGEAIAKIIQKDPKRISETVGQALVRVLIKCMAPQEDDPRVRLSGMSIAGVISAENPHLLTKDQESEVVQCALHVLRNERGEDNFVIRRSALILILECINGHSRGAFQSVSPATFREGISELEYAAQQDKDEMSRQYAKEILSILN